MLKDTHMNCCKVYLYHALSCIVESVSILVTYQNAIIYMYQFNVTLYNAFTTQFWLCFMYASFQQICRYIELQHISNSKYVAFLQFLSKRSSLNSIFANNIFIYNYRLRFNKLSVYRTKDVIIIISYNLFYVRAFPLRSLLKFCDPFIKYHSRVFISN